MSIMHMIRTFRISDRHLQGFSVSIDNLTSKHDTDYCTTYVINEMKIVLKNLGLLNMVEYINTQQWHSHEKWQTILDCPDNEFWICNHC